jgi:hypothetical protein
VADGQVFGIDWWLTRTTEQWLAEAMPRVCFGPGCCLALPAALAGASYRYDNSLSTAWIEPIADLYARPLPRFDPQAPRFVQMRACVQAQIDAVKGRAFVNPPIWLDPLTSLSLLRTPEQLCLDVIERPDDVRRWSVALTDLTLQTSEWIYELLLRHGHGEAGSFFTLMAEGRMEAVQCDFAVMLSPKQFEQFVMPDLRRLSDYFDFSLYHLDGTCQMRFLDQLATLDNLTGIQWNPEPGENFPLKWLDAFRTIRKKGLVLAVGTNSVDEAVELARELGPDGLTLFLPEQKTVQDVQQAIERIEKAC